MFQADWPTAFYLTLLGQPPVAKPSHRDILLHVKVVQIYYPYLCVQYYTMLKGGSPAEAVWEHFDEVHSNVTLPVLMIVYLIGHIMSNSVHKSIRD